MPIPRLTTRRLMILVAIVAVLLGLATPWLTLDRKALDDRRMTFMIRIWHHSIGAALGTGKEAAYHAAMRNKYKFAERYPWLPVVPDPAPPK